MDPETHFPNSEALHSEAPTELATSTNAEAALAPQPASPESDQLHWQRKVFGWLRWTFLGSQGLRSGWSVLLFVLINALFMITMISGFGFIAHHFLHIKPTPFSFTAGTELVNAAMQVLALLGAAAIVAFIERRRLLAYNLTGPGRMAHFFSGLVSGFTALSALVAALSWGGWLRFGPAALSGSQIAKYGALWGAAFLLVGCSEEGTFRCFLQFTFTRGINFWWALGINGTACLLLGILSKGNGLRGVYAVALLGLLPCLWLEIKRKPGAGFWQAAWVTSTLFGLIHTGNGGENWIGIFAAAAFGFMACVSVRLTGSAWWAIGCHAAWDWSETFFYGTADSGFVAKGHFLTTTPQGNPFWSGGTDGPEGSLLVIGVILLLLAALVAIYGRKKPVALVAAEEAAG